MDLPAGVIAPTNRAYTLPVGSFFRLDAEGLIVAQRTYWDTASWARQIGVDPRLFAPSAGSNDTDLVAAFTKAMTSDDIDGAVNLFAPQGEWVIMATGERSGASSG
jgi:ketosteroid isomerase-like protein